MVSVPSIRLPRAWPRLVRSALLHAVALGRAALVEIHSGLESGRIGRARQAAKIERLCARVRLLEEVMRIKDRRMDLIAAAERPRYLPEERLLILTMRAAQGWNAAQTARMFLLTPATITSWTRRLDEGGPDALVRAPEPVNRFPDFVALLVQRLRTALPSMGRAGVAQVLARVGLVLSASTVKRLAERRLASPEPPRPRAGGARDVAEALALRAARVVTSKRPHHVWLVDITQVPTGLGFWVPWFPFSLALSWPYCFHVVAVLDHFSRAVVTKRVFRSEPSTAEICALLDGAVREAGRAPAHIVSDQGSQFRAEYRAWCEKHRVRPRFGKIGEHGSIAIIERFWRSMKGECFRRIVVPMNLALFERELDAYVVWYNDLRPHTGLSGRTPAEVRDGVVPRIALPALEPRPRFPLKPRAGPTRLRRRLRGRLELSIMYFRKRAHLPIVELLRAA